VCGEVTDPIIPSAFENFLPIIKLGIRWLAVELFNIKMSKFANDVPPLCTHIQRPPKYSEKFTFEKIGLYLI
jgi:hypothetical protein